MAGSLHRGRETTVISAAPVWEPETLARTTARTSRRRRRGPLSFSSPRSSLSSTWFFPNWPKGHFPPCPSFPESSTPPQGWRGGRWG